MAAHRAHEFICRVSGDTLKDAVNELRYLAKCLERGELSHGGCGSPSAGSSYCYSQDGSMTHDRYFAELEAEFEAARTNAPATA